MTGRRTLAGGVALVACAAVAACGSGGGGGGGTASTGGNRAAHPTVAARGASIPGQIDPSPQGFFPRVVLNPILNAWRTSSARRFTEVDAGAYQDDRTVGVLGIFRGRSTGGAQSGNLIKVIGSGPLRIVGAPLGSSAAAQQGDARIHFAGAHGIRGVLRLRDDKVVLQPPAGARG
jgi:hypothetical protein